MSRPWDNDQVVEQPASARPWSNDPVATPNQPSPAPARSFGLGPRNQRSTLENVTAPPIAAAQGTLGGTAQLVGGALELSPGAVGRAGAAVGRFGDEQVREARDRNFVMGTAGQLAPSLLGTGASIVGQGLSMGARALRGGTTGAFLGAAGTTSGQEELPARLRDKAIPAVIGGTLGGTLGVGAGVLERVTGGQSRRQLDELKNLITSGNFEREVTAGARSNLLRESQTTEAMIASLRAEGRLTEAQARDAVRQLRLGRDRQNNPFVERREAGREAAQDRRFFEDALRQAPTEAEIGQAGLSRITQFVQNLRGNNRSVADAMYREADDAMLQKFEAGDIWQNSPSGRRYIAELRSRLDTSSTTRATGDERALVERLLRDLEGVSASTPASPVLNAAGQPVAAASTRVSPSEPSVIRETLRRLRDAGSGRPEEGFAAIGQQRAGNLADDLAKAIEPWEPSLARADARYRELMQLLQPAQTGRGRGVTAGERFDYTAPSIDPSRLPNMFFTSPQGVRQLTDLVGGDTAFVNNLANQYVARQLANKTPEQARAWLNSNQTLNWLNPRTLPEPAAQANRIVSGLEQATQRGAQAAESQQANIGSFRERVKNVREGVATAREARQTAETAARATEEAARKGLQQLETPIRELAENYRRGGVSARELPNRMRQVLNNNVDSIPREVAEAFNRKLTEFDSIRRSEDRARAIAGWAFGGGTAAVLLGREFAPSMFGGR